MPIDYRAYGRKFKVMSRVLRGYGKCALCGALNGALNDKTNSQVVLTLHHLDHDKTRHELFNLAPLCQKCHLDRHRSGAERLKWRDLSREYLVWIDVLLQFVTYIIPESHKAGDVKENTECAEGLDSRLVHPTRQQVGVRGPQRGNDRGEGGTATARTEDGASACARTGVGVEA